MIPKNLFTNIDQNYINRNYLEVIASFCYINKKIYIYDTNPTKTYSCNIENKEETYSLCNELKIEFTRLFPDYTFICKDSDIYTFPKGVQDGCVLKMAKNIEKN